MHKPIIFWTPAIILAAAVSVGLYLCYSVTRSINDHYIERPVVLKTATYIAWAELTKHFVAGKTDAGTYQLVSMTQSSTTPKVYYLRYAIPNWLDTDVLITVDIMKGIVLAYEEKGA